jgi:hypothetical protein
MAVHKDKNVLSWGQPDAHAVLRHEYGLLAPRIYASGHGFAPSLLVLAFRSGPVVECEIFDIGV